MLAIIVSLVVAWQSPVQTAWGRTQPAAKKSKTPGPKIVLAPEAEKAAPEGPSGFRLAPGKKGTLELSFFAKDRLLELDRAKPMVIQVGSDEGLRVEPSVITGDNFPKNGKPMTLKISGGANEKTYKLNGVASYVVCNRKSKACKRTKSTFQYSLKK